MGDEERCWFEDMYYLCRGRYWLYMFKIGRYFFKKPKAHLIFVSILTGHIITGFLLTVFFDLHSFFLVIWILPFLGIQQALLSAQKHYIISSKFADEI